jgi:hypothetical protein
LVEGEEEEALLASVEREGEAKGEAKTRDGTTRAIAYVVSFLIVVIVASS